MTSRPSKNKSTPKTKLSNAELNQALQMFPAKKDIQKGIKAIALKDADFAAIEKLAGKLLVYDWPADFESLARIIVGQQLSTLAALSIWNKVKATVPVTPQAIAKAKVEKLASCGLSKAKIISLKALSDEILSGRLDLEALHALDDEQARELLVKVKGIGPWTANIYLLFGLKRLDCLPANDLALLLGYQALKGLEKAPTSKELIVHCDHLKPHRGVAALLLWQYYRHIKAKPSK
ncbi:DNA-3-methyladenine glycosylase 2 family protein [bacterium]|nr:DNA-3-methyladenine glycosylase 2 family protein [bacterium]QQR56641.1 MAG: DNA-3-methyladenine glycosylase 2 family protein [Candidatus Melainabacteria bacterium]